MTKKYNTKPTSKQKRAFTKIVENHTSPTVAMREVDYSPNTSINPSNLTKSKGFIQLMEKQGLTDEFLNTALLDDIREKVGYREKELTLAYKLKGHLRSNVDATPHILQNIAFFVNQSKQPRIHEQDS